MKKNIIAIIAIFLALSSITIVANGESNTNISISDVDIPIEGNGESCLQLTDVTNLGSLQLTITYTTSIISAVNLRDSELPNFNFNIDDDAGKIHMNAYSTKTDGETGDFIIAYIEFEPEPGASTGDSSDLTISQSKIYNAQGDLINHDLDNGIATISGEDTPDGGNTGGGSQNIAPVADAGGPYEGVPHEIIEFDASSSYDSDGEIVGYRWDFNNDGTYDTTWKDEPLITNDFSEAGEYVVVVQVKDNEGKTDTDTSLLTIIQPNNNPSEPTIDGITNGSIDTNYTFTAVSYDLDGDDIKYTFKWGDDTENTETELTENNTIVNKTHKWINQGIYIIKVQAEDSEGGISSWSEHLVFIDIDYSLQQDGTYLVDNNTDGNWDSIFDPVTEKYSAYSAPENPEDNQSNDNEEQDNTAWYIAGILIIIVLILAVLVAVRKK